MWSQLSEINRQAKQGIESRGMKPLTATTSEIIGSVLHVNAGITKKSTWMWMMHRSQKTASAQLVET
tara:strand:+ start:373 stop:573 length:201 start_codon:yes stop_codon:yes gene_type:complete